MRHDTGVGIEPHKKCGSFQWIGVGAKHLEQTPAEDVPIAMVFNGISHAVMPAAAVSAPTAMALRLAIESGATLIGFARGGRRCVYSPPERVHQAGNGT